MNGSIAGSLHLLAGAVAPHHDKTQIYSGTVTDRTHRVRRAIPNLEQLSDSDLFETLSEGMPLIVENATSLEETARRLYRDGEFRASDVMLGFAEEEAAKVLILIDHVRCPRKSGRRAQVLNRFYGHVAKRIHALACEYPRIASFGELSELVERECLPWHLDGPNDIDWISLNAISQKRERDLYVDYVQDVTDAAGPCHWTAPPPPDDFQSQYPTSDCVTLVRFLFRAGALSADGLAEIADVWRDFAPEPHTDREELRDLIVETLDRLARRCGAVEEEAARFIVSHWPYPLWPLSIREPRRDNGDLDGLREEREHTVNWIEKTEARRDPVPAISRSKVEKLNDAYLAWQGDVDAHAVGNAEDRHNRYVFPTGSGFFRIADLRGPSGPVPRLDRERACRASCTGMVRSGIGG